MSNLSLCQSSIAIKWTASWRWWVQFNLAHQSFRNMWLFLIQMFPKWMLHISSAGEATSSTHGEPHQQDNNILSHEYWLPLSKNQALFTQWASGYTPPPPVNAGMHELIASGYISNCAQQNIASVWTKDLRTDWRLGAKWFSNMFGRSLHCSQLWE